MKNYNQICQAFLNNCKNKYTEERTEGTPQVRGRSSQEEHWNQNDELQNFSRLGFYVFIEAGMDWQFWLTVSCYITTGCIVHVFPIIHSVKIIYIRMHRISAAAAAAAKSLQSCLTLCDPVDGSPPGSPSLVFSRQEHWNGLPFPSLMHESENWKWSRSVVSDF